MFIKSQKLIIMSETLETYLNYARVWEHETNENVNLLISEQNLFIQLGDYNADPVIDQEFNDMVHMVHEIKEESIKASVIPFGEMILEGDIQGKKHRLNDKLKSAESDIASNINPTVKDYIDTHQ